MAEVRESPEKRSFLSRVTRRDGRPGVFGKWVSANWSTVLMLLFIFVLAMFVRSYFGYSIAHDNGNLVSGGSDSYYWERIIHYSANTGKQLYFDPMLNFPEGIRNPRPPMFSMAVVVPGILSQNAFPSVDEALGWIFLLTPAFWGSLTVIPTYLLGKETFGRRAGLAAAFFLAIMPSHVQRSVLSEADHDAFILFFIVLTFYLLLKAIKSQEHRKWVDNWRSRTAISSGLKDYLRSSRTSVLYAAMAGVAYACVIMTWVGFAYITVLILAYYMVQVLLNKIKGFDSTSVTILIAIIMSVGFLLSFPVYYEQTLIPVRFDVPVYLFLATMFFGLMFVVSRDYPWTLTFPIIFVVLAIGILAIDLVDPALAQAILSGQGYFVKSKLYSTIAEARAPKFSELALGFGMITFFLSLAGLLYAITKIPKKATAEFIFIVVWLGAAIFMAISAGRFTFNAAPAFAIASGWILILIIDRLDFNSVRRSFTGASGSYLHVFRKSVKVRHIFGALFLAFMIVLPNVWYSVDAGIPADTKPSYDKQIYDSFPSFLRPSGYDVVNGTNWYLGAFGYQLPLPKYYFPAAWSWFAQQDANVTPDAAKPGYVSWWDYGFEAIEAGKHPAVADNFQNGYQLTGNALMAQGEADAIAIFTYRLLQVSISRGGALEDQVLAILDQSGVNSTRMHEILIGPGQPIVNQVLADPGVYGPMAADTSVANARIVAARVALTSIGLDSLVTLYDRLMDATGWQIRYFNVDSRLFPISGQNTGIFYAPAKLSDRRIVEGSIPIDFFDINAITTTGQTVSLKNLTADMQISDYQIVYKDMFYKSMLYKAMGGFTATDIGQTGGGVPGLSGSLQNYNALPGWNLTHFRMVYRTALYNPSSSSNPDRNLYQSISYDDAQVLKKQIEAGTIPGFVIDSGDVIYSQGTTFLKYYAGAYVNGTLTTEQGYPVAGIRVTMADQYGIPHGTTFTDKNGHYALLAPFGQASVTFSEGNVTSPSLAGSNSIKTLTFNVTDDQAMRVPEDLNNDGILDYIITKDYVMKGTEVTGTIFWDLDHDRNYTAGTDPLIEGTTTFASERKSGLGVSIDSSAGTFDVFLPPGQYDFTTVVNGLNTSMANQINVTAGKKADLLLGVDAGTFKGTLKRPDGTPVPGIPLALTDLAVGFSHFTETDSMGNFTFGLLVPDNYSLTSNVKDEMVFNVFAQIDPGSTALRNVTLFPSATLNITVSQGGRAVPFATFMVTDVYDTANRMTGLADEFGRIDTRIPMGQWTLYGNYFAGNGYSAGLIPMDLSVANQLSAVLELTPAVEVVAGLRAPTTLPVIKEFITFQAANGARVPAQTDGTGMANIVLPAGSYGVTASSQYASGVYSGQITVTASPKSFTFRLVDAVEVSGTVYKISDGIVGLATGDIGRLAEFRMVDQNGFVFTSFASLTGAFTVMVPKDAPVTFSIADPGYSGWSRAAQYSQTVSSLTLVAQPDNVTVAGVVTFMGVPVRGVQVDFLPQQITGTLVHATTGLDGSYTASMEPSTYTVSVNQNTGPGGGERYQATLDEKFLPTGAPDVVDIQTVKRVQMFGNILGAGSNLQVSLKGPEQKNLTLTALNYSVFLLPGDYDVYITGSLGSASFANISLANVSATSRQHDFQMQASHSLSGTIKLGSSPPGKAVTVTATTATNAVVHTTSTSTGFYNLALPPGSYSLTYVLEEFQTVGSQSLFVEWFAQTNVSISSTGVSVSPSLQLRLDNTTMTGESFGPAGAPQLALISLLPNTKFGQAVSFLTDPSGNFSEAVQPGEYTMYVTGLQDKTASLSVITLTRNVPLHTDIGLKAASYLSGHVTLAGANASVPLSLTSGSTKLSVQSDASGGFVSLLPPGNYTLASTQNRLERGVNVTYALSTNTAVDGNDVFVPMEFVRDTKRTVSATWDKNQTQTAAPGVKVTYSFTVTNTGNIADTYLITYVGSGFNVTVSPGTLGLDFGTDDTATVTVNVTALKTVSAGKQSVPLLVRSKSLATVRFNLEVSEIVQGVRGTLVTPLNVSQPVSSKSTITKFRLNNTANVPDTIDLQVSNLGSLRALGWDAVIIETTSNQTVTNVTFGAFGSTDLAVRFISLRTDADPTAKATVLAVSQNDTGASSSGEVPVILPDLELKQDGLQAIRDDVAFESDQASLYIDMGLLVALAALFAMFFIFRKRKGFGRPSAKGGAKK